jgi:hypothetical protein
VDRQKEPRNAIRYSQAARERAERSVIIVEALIVDQKGEAEAVPVAMGEEQKQVLRRCALQNDKAVVGR